MQKVTGGDQGEQQERCPACGYCPHCGQSTAPPTYIPAPFPVYPQYPSPWPWGQTWITSGGLSLGGSGSTRKDFTFLEDFPTDTTAPSVSEQ